MASVLLSFENQGEDKHVESVLLPRSDTGSTPVSSTIFFVNKYGIGSIPILYTKSFCNKKWLLNWCLVHGTCKGVE